MVNPARDFTIFALSADTSICNGDLFTRWILPTGVAPPFVLYPAITLVLEWPKGTN